MSEEKSQVPFKQYTATSKSVWLKAPLESGVPGAEHFEIRTETLELSGPSESKGRQLKDGDILLKVLAMSADPYLRGGIKSSRGRPSGASIMVGFVAGKILASRNPKWVAGDLIGASLPFTTVQVVSGKALASTVSWKLTGLIEEKNISLGVGVMGMPGSTAYGGLLDVLSVQKNQTIFVSSASGAVGSLVGQIAKHVYDCKVIGSAGGPAKGKYLIDHYGFDSAIDYKALKSVENDNGLQDLIGQLKKAAPDGIDMYFENVGGVHFEAAMSSLRVRGRVAVCGTISGYNEAKPTYNKINISQMIYSFQRVEGFVCMPWLSGSRGKFLEDMSRWLKEGKIKPDETFFDGIDEWSTAFNSLFTNTARKRGKVVVRMGEKDFNEKITV